MVGHDPSYGHGAPRWTVEYGQSSARATNPCRTGFSHQYRTAARHSASSRMHRSQYRRCHTPRSPCRTRLSEGAATSPTARENRCFSNRHRVGKSASPSGSVHTACRRSGSTTIASHRTGMEAIVAAKAARNASIRATRRTSPRRARFTVKTSLAPGTRSRRHLDMPPVCHADP